MPNWKKVIVSGSDASLNSLNVATSLTASGLIYPIADGTTNQSIVTDGAGNLSFGNPYSNNTIVYGKNLSGGTIEKGTPLYFTGSGTSGNLVGVFPADAGNPARMPAGGIAGEQLLDEAEGVILLNGFINGVDTSAFGSGDEVFVGVGGGYTNVPPTGSVGGNIVLVQKLGNVEKVNPSNGSGVINGPGAARSVPRINPGYTWVGDGDYVAQAVSTASLLVTTASYASNATSASYAFNSTSSSYALTASFIDGPIEGAKTFQQGVANVTWSFVHNFGTYTPIVQVYDASYNQLVPANVVGISDDTTEIYFAYPKTGYAIISTGGNLLVTGSNAKLIQTSAAATWSFEHGLGEQFPVFTVFDNNNDVIIPTRITADNAFTASIYFSSARTGTAVAANCGLSGSIFDTSISSSFAQTASFALNGGVTSIVAGEGISIDQSTGVVTISATGETFGGSIVTSSFINVTSTFYNHNFNSRDVLVKVYDTNSNEIIPSSLTLSSVNRVDATFASPQSGYMVIMKGSSVNSVTGSYSSVFTASLSHSFNTQNLNIEVYDENFNVVIPTTLSLPDASTIQATFNSLSSGTIVAFAKENRITSSFTNVPSVSIPNTLNTLNVEVAIYDSSYSTFIPDNILVTTSSIDIDFSVSSSGYVVIMGGPIDATKATLSTSFKTAISGASIYNIQHNLDEEFPLVQVYESASRLQYMPQSISSIDEDVIQITFISPFNGYVIINS